MAISGNEWAIVALNREGATLKSACYRVSPHLPEEEKMIYGR
jgi:hypothetical protein